MEVLIVDHDFILLDSKGNIPRVKQPFFSETSQAPYTDNVQVFNIAAAYTVKKVRGTENSYEIEKNWTRQKIEALVRKHQHSFQPLRLSWRRCRECEIGTVSEAEECNLNLS